MMSSVAMRTVLRPQPLGVFDGPAGLVLIRAGDGVPELLGLLARGAQPDVWPQDAEPFAAVLADDVEGALTCLTDDPCDRVNRLVLEPTQESYADARLAAADSPELNAVVTAAAYAAGLTDELPASDMLDGEFASLVATVAASDALAAGDRHAARPALERAVALAVDVGPALHGRALAALAELRYQLEGPSDAVADAYGQASRVLADSGLALVRAGVQVQQGVVLHELSEGRRGLLIEAIRLYQSALLVLEESEYPEEFAFASMNVALAILALPTIQASDQVRLGVAVQSLRAALRVYTEQTHPDQWSSGRLNLANALQYLPSGHREDNLAEAVEIYEELLQFRSPQRDPAGYARVLANQANALAHLGILDHAREKYFEARLWFSRLGEDDAVRVMDDQLEELEKTRAAHAGSDGDGVGEERV